MSVRSITDDVEKETDETPAQVDTHLTQLVDEYTSLFQGMGKA